MATGNPTQNFNKADPDACLHRFEYSPQTISSNSKIENVSHATTMQKHKFLQDKNCPQVSDHPRFSTKRSLLFLYDSRSCQTPAEHCGRSFWWYQRLLAFSPPPPPCPCLTSGVSLSLVGWFAWSKYAMGMFWSPTKKR